MQASARLKIRQIQFKLCIFFHYSQYVREQGNPARWMKSSHVPAWAALFGGGRAGKMRERVFRVLLGPSPVPPRPRRRSESPVYSQWHPSHSQHRLIPLSSISAIHTQGTAMLRPFSRCQDRFDFLPQLRLLSVPISSLRPTKRSDF
jgi:hypothetical protein